MKINWGHKLVFFMVLFMVFIVVMVYKIGSQQVDLVDKNYYEKGIQYQEEINKFNASDSIQYQIVFNKEQKEISFVTNVSNLEGTVYFYRPSDAKLDFNIPFKLNERGEFSYSLSDLKSGTWKVTFEWKLKGELMAAERYIVIEK